MVHGLDKFKSYFKDYTNQYVFIGGTACAILLEDLGSTFRATKDLDIVLIIEALDDTFGEAFEQFIVDGGYSHRGKEGKRQYYRFSKPKDSTFPEMIELFSRQPVNINLKFDNQLTPIHIDDSVISLSAILLDDDYYSLLRRENQVISGYPVIKIETVIVFKMKAWLDLKHRKEMGEDIGSKIIRKHKNDVFRLLVNVDPSSRVKLSKNIQKDVNKFSEKILDDIPDLKNLGITRTSLNEMLDLISAVYLGN